MNDLDQKAGPCAGFDAVIEAYKKDIDVTLIRENLRLTLDLDVVYSRSAANGLAWSA